MQQRQVPPTSTAIKASPEAVRKAIEKLLASQGGPQTVAWSDNDTKGTVSYVGNVPTLGETPVSLTFELAPSDVVNYRHHLRRVPATVFTVSGTMDFPDTVMLYGEIPLHRELQRIATVTVSAVEKVATGGVTL